MVCRVGFIFWEGIAKQGPISCISPGCISPGCISPGTVQETAASAPAASDTVQLPQRLHQPNDLIHFSHPLTGMMSTTRSKSLVLVSCPKQNTMSRRRQAQAAASAQWDRSNQRDRSDKARFPWKPLTNTKAKKTPDRPKMMQMPKPKGDTRK